MLNYFTASTVSELACLLLALSCLFKDASWVWRSMILYMLITCISEFYGKYIGDKTHNNQWIYNIFLVFEAGFNNLMFAHIFKQHTKSKLIISIGLALFAGLYIFELGKHGFFVYNNLTYSAMSVVYVLYSLYYYYLLLRDDEGYINLKDSIFWWVAGALLFYFGATACNIFNDQLDAVTIFNHQQLSYLIFKVLNIILYGCWSYSFICRKWLTTTSKA